MYKNLNKWMNWDKSEVGKLVKDFIANRVNAPLNRFHTLFQVD